MAAPPAGSVRRDVAALAMRLASASAATMLLNGFNFVLGLVLVRRLAPAAFGAWATMTTMQAVAGAIVTAGFAQQMAYAFPRRTHPASLRAGVAVFDRAAVLAMLLFAPLTVATLAALGMPVAVVLAGSGYTVAAMYRSYVRARAFALRRPAEALRGDAIFVAVATLGLVLLLPSARAPLASVLIMLALAHVAALGRGGGRAFTRAGWRRAVRAYRRHLPRARWSFATVILSTAAMLGPNIALASTGQLAAVAIVAAPATLLAPLRLVALTAQASMRAEFAALVHARRIGAALMLYAGASAGALLLGALLALLVALGWEPLRAHLFARYDDGALLRLAVALALLAAVVNIARLPGAMLLNALGVFRASATAMACVVPPALLWAIWAAHAGRVAETLYAPLGSEALLLGIEGAVLARAVRGLETRRACRGC